MKDEAEEGRLIKVKWMLVLWDNVALSFMSWDLPGYGYMQTARAWTMESPEQRCWATAVKASKDWLLPQSDGVG